MADQRIGRMKFYATASAENNWGVVELTESGNMRAHTAMWSDKRANVAAFARDQKWQFFSIMRRFARGGEKKPGTVTLTKLP